MAKNEIKKRTKSELNSLIQTASNYKQKEIKFRSTGILPLDLALKSGGYMPGRPVEVFGPEHSGKTLMTLLAIIWDQMVYKKKSLFVDAEASFDLKWFKQLGGNLDLLDIYDPYKHDEVYGELVYDNVIDLIEANNYSFVVLDSLMGGALISKEILDKSLQETHRMGANAKLNKAFYQRVLGKCIKKDTTFITTNHLVDKIGVMFGNPETTPGGKALKFYSEQRVRIGTPKDKKENIGHRVTGSIVKNKRGNSAGQKFEFYLSYKNGIDNFEEMRKLLVKHDLLGKKDKIDINLKNYEEYKKQLLDIYNDIKLDGETESNEVDDGFVEEGVFE